VKIGQLALQAGMRASAVRYYERIGLLPPPSRVSGRREYEPEVLERLRVIELCQRAGLSLEEIAVLLKEMTPGRLLSQTWKSMAQRKLGELDGLISQIMAMREILTEGLRCGCLSLSDCTLIARIGAERASPRTRKPPVTPLRQKSRRPAVPTLARS
jgi:DNA-binding transcriptional MerR regulator